MKKLIVTPWYFTLLIFLSFIMSACSDGGTDGQDVGSAALTNTEIDSMNFSETVIPLDRVFNDPGRSPSPLQLNVDRITFEAKETNGKVTLSTDFPMRINIDFSNFTTSAMQPNAGLTIVFLVANYTAENIVSDTFPENRRFAPIGSWTTVVNSSDGTISPLCRVVNGDFDEKAYNCANTFDFQGFGGIEELVSNFGIENVHLLVQIVGDIDVTDTFTPTADSSIITSVPIYLP